MRRIFIYFTLLFLLAPITQAQPTLESDYSFVMDVPRVVTMTSSPAHFYVLSESEGMAVFRARPDSLQWLYSSTGMQRRGHNIVADIRFAYLFGNSNRLSILEPTSVLGVYSSTQLPGQPLDVKRMGQNLYVAIQNQGLGKISLASSSAVDAGVNFVESPELKNSTIIDLAGTEQRLFVLSDQQLLRFDYDGQNLSLSQSNELSQKLSNILWVDNTLFGTDSNGNIFKVEGSNTLSKVGNIGEEISTIVSWKDWTIVRGASGRLWKAHQDTEFELWKEDRKAGNHITVSKNNLWLTEYNQITKVKAKQQETNQAASSPSDAILSLAEIQDYTIPHSESLVFPIKLNSGTPANNVQFTYQSADIQDAVIRGQSFYWEPTSSDIGSHEVKIIASANGETVSTSFNIHVRSFNAPPRFTPIRSVTIPVGEEFTLPFNAVDPDGIDKNLIRFIGVNLPKGASINESSGTVRWTPTARQTGKNTFRVIATDQYGTAASVDVTINVSDSVQRENTTD